MRKLVVLAAAMLLPMSLAAAGSAHHTALATTTITVNGGGGDRVYDGVGAILGGGGNARYLEDYPAARRAQIMNYLFEPGYGASLQLLKLEIGGDANSSAGAEPSIEHTQGNINCGAGWEFDIAKQAIALNPNLKLYGLQWGAPGWAGQPVSGGGTTLFTTKDITYLIDWLNCAKQEGRAAVPHVMDFRILKTGPLQPNCQSAFNLNFPSRRLIFVCTATFHELVKSVPQLCS